MSRLVNWRDRRTCVMFGDGAGAVVLGRTQGGESRLADTLDSVIHTDGQGHEVIHVPAGGSSLPLNSSNIEDGLQYVHMDGRKVFEFAVSALVSAVRELLDRSGMEVGHIDHVIPHQANVRIIERGMCELGMPGDKAITHLERYGNTSAASIPIALDESSS
jgi:3-oxoacyl-[acyl-carrier-protein] synthase-3